LVVVVGYADFQQQALEVVYVFVVENFG